MADVTTLEEAKRCPKCGNYGEDRIQRPVDRSTGLKAGTMVHIIYCVTEICPWFNTCWMVQVNKDGSIPPPQNHTGHPKVYQGFEGHDQQAKELIDFLKAEEKAQTQPGTEVRNPYA